MFIAAGRLRAGMRSDRRTIIATGSWWSRRGCASCDHLHLKELEARLLLSASSLPLPSLAANVRTIASPLPERVPIVEYADALRHPGPAALIQTEPAWRGLPFGQPGMTGLADGGLRPAPVWIVRAAGRAR